MKQQPLMQEEEFVTQSEALFNRYYENTKAFRQKCADNENFWKSDHWASKPQKPNEPYPSVPALFSAIENLHSEIMDSYPEAMILPYGKEDEPLAKTLSSIIEITLERCSFPSKYRKEMLRLLKRGVCCFSVVWNSALSSGYGDIEIVPWDMRYLLWDTTREDIQSGENVFKFSYYSPQWFESHYPHKYRLIAESRDKSTLTSSYGNDSILLIERWYKKYDPATGKTLVHMAKLAGGVLLEWSERDPSLAETGIYADGLYPFVLIPLYEVDDSPVGMGMIDVFKSEQEYIDMLDRAILKNTLMSGKIRLLKDTRCNIPKEKLADWNEDVLEGSDISERSIRWIQPASISPMASQHLSFKIDALKRDSGQTDITRGEYDTGVTAASAIIALQNAASKRTRNVIGRIYDGYIRIIHMIISRISQFYDDTRVVHISGENGIIAQYYIPPQMPIDPLFSFDIKVKARKKNMYEVTYNNELAEKLFNSGVISAQDMLELMNFEGKEAIQKKLTQKSNG